MSCVDLVSLNDTQMLINTASIGAYPGLVRMRERFEHKIGKPPAAAYAMLRTLRHEDPVRIRYDNKTMQTSLFFLGNSTYLPSGFAPVQRNRIDTGVLDVRILETGRPLSRFRINALPGRASVARGQAARLHFIKYRMGPPTRGQRPRRRPGGLLGRSRRPPAGDHHGPVRRLAGLSRSVSVAW